MSSLDIFGNKDKVDISISKVHTNRADLPEYISIEITDNLSRSRIIEVSLSMEDFARLITGFYMEASAELPSKNAMEKFGKKMESKIEFISIDGYQDFAKKYKKAAKKFEVDGWVVDEETEHNHHRVSAEGYKAIFRRWVHV